MYHTFWICLEVFVNFFANSLSAFYIEIQENFAVYGKSSQNIFVGFSFHEYIHEVFGKQLKVIFSIEIQGFFKFSEYIRGIFCKTELHEFFEKNNKSDLYTRGLKKIFCLEYIRGIFVSRKIHEVFWKTIKVISSIEIQEKFEKTSQKL